MGFTSVSQRSPLCQRMWVVYREAGQWTYFPYLLWCIFFVQLKSKIVCCYNDGLSIFTYNILFSQDIKGWAERQSWGTPSLAASLVPTKFLIGSGSTYRNSSPVIHSLVCFKNMFWVPTAGAGETAVSNHLWHSGVPILTKETSAPSTPVADVST